MVRKYFTLVAVLLLSIGATAQHGALRSKNNPPWVNGSWLNQLEQDMDQAWVEINLFLNQMAAQKAIAELNANIEAMKPAPSGSWKCDSQGNCGPVLATRGGAVTITNPLQAFDASVDLLEDAVHMPDIERRDLPVFIGLAGFQEGELFSGVKATVPELVGFAEHEEAMIAQSLKNLSRAGYDVRPMQQIAKIESSTTSTIYGMSWSTGKTGAVLGENAFTSQQMLDHVLEEELLHLNQGLSNRWIGVGDVQQLEGQVDAARKFPAPNQ